MHHLDTLKSLVNLNIELFNRIHESSAAYNRYLMEIRGNFSENEMAEITMLVEMLYLSKYILLLIS